jgi:hypothetical protein
MPAKRRRPEKLLRPTEIDAGPEMLIVGDPTPFGIPARLAVIKGEIIDLPTGKPFRSKLPDWTKVNVIPHKALIQMTEEISQLKLELAAKSGETTRPLEKILSI